MCLLFESIHFPHWLSGSSCSGPELKNTPTSVLFWIQILLIIPHSHHKALYSRTQFCKYERFLQCETGDLSLFQKVPCENRHQFNTVLLTIACLPAVQLWPSSARGWSYIYRRARRAWFLRQPIKHAFALARLVSFHQRVHSEVSEPQDTERTVWTLQDTQWEEKCVNTGTACTDNTLNGTMMLNTSRRI